MFDFATSSALLTTLVTSLLTKASTDLYNSSTDKSHETIKKILNNLKLNDKIQAYYKATTGSIDPIKTFMFRENAVPFYRIYYPISISRDNPNTNSKEILNVDEKIKNIFSNNKYITIIGSAGSGKTMLVKHLFLSAVNEAKLIPVMIEFRKIDNGQTIYDYVKSKIFNLLTAEDSIFESIINTGKLLFILDGFDEIPGIILKKRVREIESLTEKYNTNNYVLTSRPGVNAEVLPRFSTYHICDLKGGDLSPFIDQQCLFMSEGYTLARKIKEAIRREGVRDAYNDYFKNPLLLSMFITVFNDYPELPSNKCEFYENVFEVLWSKHDSGKGGGFKHDKNYDKKTYEGLLSEFCYRSFFDERYIFTENYLDKKLSEVIERKKLDCDIDKVKSDLISNISILFQDGNIYTFPHRSMQEYFTAKFIEKRPVTSKNKFYTERIKNINNKIEIGNLISLLLEVDKYYCYKYFILPNYKIIVKQLECNGKKDEQIIKSFLLYFKLKVSMTFNHFSYFNPPFLRIMSSIYPDLNWINKILNSFYNHQIEIDWSFFPLETLPDNNVFTEGLLRIICADTNEQRSILNSMGITKIVKDFYQYLKDSIKEINQYIKDEDESDI